jgi:hypothetical protein
MNPCSSIVAGIAAALSGCAAAQVPPAPAAAASIAPAFVCRAFLRPTPQARIEPLDEIRMSEPGDRSVSLGGFRFRVLYSNDRYEGAAIGTYVYSGPGDQPVEHTLFQFDPDEGLVDQFRGGHGFTGLHYVDPPGSAAELQYFCSRR